MSTHSNPCGFRPRVTALADEDLSGPEQKEVEAHLEQCEGCLALFRHRTTDRFPRFPNYTITGELGRGGFGVVYKAYHHGKARVEAIKMLFGTTALREAYFENEVHSVARLRHPNIATLHEAHLRTPPRYYTMEFVEGQQLDDYLQSKPLALEERLTIIRTVAAAVDYAHAEGVVHRDLKPQNILIDPHGQPRIIDFGIAKRLGLTTADDASAGAPPPHEGPVGTRGYMAPEQLAGLPVDSRADIYSLGALLFHVLTGQPAQLATDGERLPRLLRAREVSRADDLAAIIARSVHPDPAQRYPSAGALVDDLDRYLAGREILARTDHTPGERVTRFASLMLRYHPVAVSVLTVAVLVVVLTFIFWNAGARWATAGIANARTSMVAFTDRTLAAIRDGRCGADLPGLSPTNPKSWRLLYGRLLEKLSAARPSVVAFDYHFPDAQPDYDPAFAAGIRAVQFPVIVGTSVVDVNGEPILSAELRAAVHSWGTLYSKNPEYLPDEVLHPVALRRGFNPLAPALIVAAFGAARFPDCTLDLSLESNTLYLRYRKQQVASGEPRFLAVSDQIPIYDVDVADSDDRIMEPGDKLVRARFPLAGARAPKPAPIPFEDVLAADATQLQAWFDGNAVMVGRMMGNADRYTLRSGEDVYGCQVQAAMLDSLFANVRSYRVGGERLFLRIVAWTILAALLARIAPVQPSWAKRGVALLLAALFVAGLVGSDYLPARLMSAAGMEFSVGLCTLVVVGAPLLLINALHRRQLHLTPGPVWLADGTTVSTTVLARAAEGAAPSSSVT